MSLQLYTSLVKKDSNSKVEDISLIKSGFSFGAFFFSLFWLLSHTMWRGLIIFLLIEIFIIELFNASVFGFAELFVVQVSLFVILGVNAKKWLSENLQKHKGYERVGYVLAQNEGEARLKSMESWCRNSPDLSFDEFSEEVTDPVFYLRSLDVFRDIVSRDLFKNLLSKIVLLKSKFKRIKK